jgi:hypothetical protein
MSNDDQEAYWRRDGALRDVGHSVGVGSVVNAVFSMSHQWRLVKLCSGK